jgi:hypothetical protein
VVYRRVLEAGSLGAVHAMEVLVHFSHVPSATTML